MTSLPHPSAAGNIVQPLGRAITATSKCSNCGGLGVVDVGALMSAWGTIPCPACAEDRNELIAIGASWKRDSSLEKWFPMTAEELRRLKAENIRQADTLARIRQELQHYRGQV